jgi:DNA-binding response OmpR family regulator
VSPRRVLLVEDDADTSAMLEMLLISDGHEVGIAHTLLEALREVDGSWDVVLSDLGLPDGTGLEVARKMRERSPRPRLIALSGFGSPEDLARSRDAGFDEHLIKPLDFDALRTKLKSAETNL